MVGLVTVSSAGGGEGFGGSGLHLELSRAGTTVPYVYP